MNKGAEGLRIQIDSWVENPGARAHANANLNDALAEAKAEGAREAVERIRHAILFTRTRFGAPPETIRVTDLIATLDEEAAR